MKMLLVLTMDLPEPEKIVDVLDILDPPNLPYFAGKVRIVVDPSASEMEEWLDE